MRSMGFAARAASLRKASLMAWNLSAIRHLKKQWQSKRSVRRRATSFSKLSESCVNEE